MHFVPGAGDYLTVCVCVLLICSGGMSAPTGKPYWENPCGNRGSTHSLDLDMSQQRTTAEMLRPLLLRSQIALSKALVFSKEWVCEFFVYVLPPKLDINMMCDGQLLSLSYSL